MTPQEMAEQDVVVAVAQQQATDAMFDQHMQVEYDLPELADTYEEATARMIANRYLAALAAILMTQNLNEASFRAEVDFLKRRLEEKNAALDRNATWLREQLFKLTKFFTFTGKSKSLTLPYGRVGFRKSRDKVDYIDEAKVRAWAETFAPETLRTVTEIRLDRARVNALALESTEPHVAMLLDSGAVRVYRGTDEFYVTPTQGDTKNGRETA